MKHGMLKDGAVGESPFLGFWFNFVEGCAVQVQCSKGSMFKGYAVYVPTAFL